MSQSNVIIVHGAYGHPFENWFNWMKTELESLGIECVVPQLPTPNGQELKNWLHLFNSTVSPMITPDTILIGHSLGAAFLLRWLEQTNHFVSTTFAVNTVSSSLASVINGLTPLCTLILGMVFFSSKQKLSVLNLLSIVLGFVGIIIINSDASIYQGSAIELIALLATTISYGITANYFKYYARTKDPILVSAVSALVSAITMLMFKCATKSSINTWGMQGKRILMVEK